MIYTLYVVEPLCHDSVLIKETNEWMNDYFTAELRNMHQISLCAQMRKILECWWSWPPENM